MKKIICLIFVLLIFPALSWADEIKEPQEIQFIYINGSNNNDKKMRNWFFNGMKKMHPYMYKEFNETNFTANKFLDAGKYIISKEPEAFFWGYRSEDEIQTLNSDLKITQMFSPKLAQTVRKLLAHYLHDAIWVSHYRNMHPIVDDLHKQVMENHKKNKAVVILGYSAGAFVSYEYMFNKLPDISLYDYFKHSNVNDDFLKFVKENKREDTCIDALIESNLAIYSADGKLIPNIYTNDTKNNYLNIDKYTCEKCIPKGTLKGVINFASPLVLFYSDISNPEYPLTYYNKLLYKYLIENDIFWLTVNYADDPLGYPTSKNLSYPDIQEKIKLNIYPNEGFVYSKSNIKSKRTFLGAHTSYWDTAKKFSKTVVEAYEEGYRLYNNKIEDI